MEKILRCQHKKHWKNYPIIVLPIDEIWQSVKSVDTLPTVKRKPFKKNLIEDIKRDGMHFPIMVVHTTHRDLLEVKEEYEERINNLPFWHNDRNPQSKKLWSVWGGSQRLDVAKRLGYTHIECAVLPDIKKAISHQKDMRAPYESRYYK
jgi:hypothetical protein